MERQLSFNKVDRNILLAMGTNSPLQRSTKSKLASRPGTLQLEPVPLEQGNDEFLAYAEESVPFHFNYAEKKHPFLNYASDNPREEIQKILAQGGLSGIWKSKDA